MLNILLGPLVAPGAIILLAIVLVAIFVIPIWYAIHTAIQAKEIAEDANALAVDNHKNASQDRALERRLGALEDILSGAAKRAQS